ncbi:2'-5' RNA ligase family protein [Alkaliphilus serpentinus]|uniref:2'-5' RNA ligase family protein n=1 Tax=Alkaliphilus serpentinus TaxID=1482731 RepID=A0A833HLG1_9FIRM|nr:2'-5' RNA ligase family protein [Alkaliphilus serpentinus]KAB3525749.1 2'-5' RNA ligase family protein [Alkaliphilus serpentinus]
MNKNAQRSVLCLFPENKIDGMEDFRQKYIFHPGKSVPFHITLFHNFLLPHEFNEGEISKLTEIAKSTPKFDFWAKPLSCFPTTKVLYLTPSPVTPIEALVTKLNQVFPNFINIKYGFPVFHMTIGLGNPIEESKKITDEFFERFSDVPLSLKAGNIGVYSQYGDEWRKHLSVNLGK